MTEAEKEIVWNALHLAKVKAAQVYNLTSHIEGSDEQRAAVDKAVNEAMDIINSAVEEPPE